MYETTKDAGAYAPIQARRDDSPVAINSITGMSQRLDKALAVLHQTITDLQERLAPLTAPYPSNGIAQSKDRETTAGSAHAQTLDAYGDSVNAAIERLRMLHGAVDL